MSDYPQEYLGYYPVPTPRFSRTVILDLGVLKDQAELPEDIWEGEDKEPPEFFQVAYCSTLPRDYEYNPGSSNESMSVSYLVFQKKDVTYHIISSRGSRYPRIQTVYTLVDFSYGVKPKFKPEIEEKMFSMRKLRLE